MYPYEYERVRPDDVERIAKLVIRLKERDARKKAKAKEVEEKKAQDSSRRLFSALEWFIIGVLMQPMVGPLYNLALHKLQGIAP